MDGHEGTDIVLWEVDRILGRVDYDGEGRPSGVHLFSGAEDTLRHLRAQSIRNVIKSTHAGWAGHDVLSSLAPSTASCFDPELSFEHECVAATVTAKLGKRAVLASANHRRRAAFVADGMAAVPHRSLAREACAHAILTYVRIDGMEREERMPCEEHVLLPLYRSPAAPDVLFAMTTLAAVECLRRAGWRVELFGAENEPIVTELYRLSLDDSAKSDRFVHKIAKQGNTHLRLGNELLVALRADQEIDELHPPVTTHGHTLLLLPMDPIPGGRRSDTLALTSSGTAVAEHAPCAMPVLAAPSLSAEDRKIITDTITGELVDELLRCWCGIDPLPGTTSQKVKSRHIGHPDNKSVTAALQRKLGDILGNAAPAPFDYGTGTRSNVHGWIVGTDPGEIVLVGAHFDSVGAPKAAPGADDDASGMAGLLAVATALRALSDKTPPRRGIRFALFNGEETGFQGSIAYAQGLGAGLSSGKAPKPVAMLQMDMIGTAFGEQKENQAEIHPGGDLDFAGIDPCLRQRTQELAALIKAEGEQTVPNLEYEMFPRPGESFDPLGSASDHHRFLVWANCPACLVTENAFNATTTKIASLNKAYHTKDDTYEKVSKEYVAKIACTVAATVWRIANAENGNPERKESMPTKRIAQLVGEFLDPAQKQLRANILKNHDTGLLGANMSQQQKDLLGTMRSRNVLPQMVAELGDPSFPGNPPTLDQAMLKQLIKDFDAKGTEVHGPEEPEGETSPMADSNGEMSLQAAAAYTSDGVHIFAVEPAVVSPGTQVRMVIRGNGYEHDVATNTLPLVRFVPGQNIEPGDDLDAWPNTVAAQVLSISCDVDLNERVTVDVTFPTSGPWRAQIKNAADPTWAGNAEGKNTIRVLPF